MALACGVSACSSSKQTTYVPSEEPRSTYALERGYNPPGPSEDPWGPYITEASERFQVPEIWIREVMRQESGGRQYMGGQLTTSPKGAAGLMQVMPATYAELRDKYGLGDDRYDPHNNILAGTAYIREMYDLYGYPGFLAAYNAGPGRLERHMFDGTPLPAETRNYLASVAPRLAGSVEATGLLASYAGMPSDRSAEDLNRKALAALPDAAPARPTTRVISVARAAPTAPAPVQVASAAAYAPPARTSSGSGLTTDELNRRANAGSVPAPAPAPRREPVVVAAAVPAPEPVAKPEPVRQAEPPAAPVRLASATFAASPAPATNIVATPVSANLASETAVTDMSARQLSAALSAPTLPASYASASSPSASSGMAPAERAAARLASAAPAATPAVAGPGIQVGAFSSPAQAEAAAQKARSQGGSLLSVSRSMVSPVTRGDGSVLYRAWLVGLTADRAGAACDTLSRQGVACMVLSGDRMA